MGRHSFRRSQAAGPVRIGACQLCGGRERELRLTPGTDFYGWACEACRQELEDSLPRRWCNAGEETEPGE